MVRTYTTLDSCREKKDGIALLPLYYCLLVLVCMGSTFHSVMAQQQHPDEEKAFKILDQISQNCFQATFTYTHQSPQLALLENFDDGKIIVHDHKYHLILPDQEIINDGQTVWIYFKVANEVQVADHDPEQETLTPWTIFSHYRRDYDFFRLDTHQADKQFYDCVTLVAKDTDNTLTKVIITVARATKHIKSIEIMDHNQALHNFFVTYFVYNLEFDELPFYFSLDKHPGIEVIDMR